MHNANIAVLCPNDVKKNVKTHQDLEEQTQKDTNFNREEAKQLLSTGFMAKIVEYADTLKDEEFGLLFGV